MFSNKMKRDLEQTELFIKQSFEAMVSRYLSIFTEYENRDDANMMEYQYEKWLAEQIINIARLKNHAGRKGIFDRLEELLNPDTPTHEEESVIDLILNDRSVFPIYSFDIKRWEELYPAVDVLAQLRKMAGWCEANPKRRKTKSGIKRFVNSWLAADQDRGGAVHISGVQHGVDMNIPPDGTAHPDGGIWMNGKQVLGVKPK